MSDQPSLFDSAPADDHFADRRSGESGVTDDLFAEIAALAARLPSWLHLGTSSWTYPGWHGTVYSKKFAQTDVLGMLREYVKYPLFSTVGIDSAFYRPLSEKTLRNYAEILPDGFRCVQKVWNRITAYRMDRVQNPDWMNAELFIHDVLDPMMTHFEQHAGPLVFEFETIHKSGGVSGEQFTDRLDAFFSRLPSGPMYAVELRNPEFMRPDYFAMLRSHNVAHCWNAWSRMNLEDQIQHDAYTADFSVARLLLKPGRGYQEAVDTFQPYDRIQEPQDGILTVVNQMLHHEPALKNGFYVLGNNRLEGHAPTTLGKIARNLLH